MKCVCMCICNESRGLCHIRKERISTAVNTRGGVGEGGRGEGVRGGGTVAEEINR